MAHHLFTALRRATRPASAAAALILATGALAACGSDSGSESGSDGGPSSPTAARTVEVGANAGDAATPVSITVTPDPDARAKLPQEIRDAGTITIGVGALPAGLAPLEFVGEDEKTLTGSEPDFGRLVAAALGLTPKIENVSWENLFVRLDSGQFDVGFSNITDTEERKEKYDFASYRKDELAFEVLADSDWSFAGDYRTLDGLTVAVGSGTNQEKILLEWDQKLRAEGKKGISVKYFSDTNSQLLALQSGKIDAYFGPNPGIAYQIAQSAGGEHPLRNAGTFSGAGATLQGLIAATTKKDSGLAEPLAEAINHLIEGGEYAAWLKAYHLSEEAVTTSEVNPPGLPKDNT
jgi:polar amino acid transport system substrate-binding protein